MTRFALTLAALFASPAALALSDADFVFDVVGEMWLPGSTWDLDGQLALVDDNRMEGELLFSSASDPDRAPVTCDAVFVPQGGGQWELDMGCAAADGRTWQGAAACSADDGRAMCLGNLVSGAGSSAPMGIIIEITGAG